MIDLFLAFRPGAAELADRVARAIEALREIGRGETYPIAVVRDEPALPDEAWTHTIGPRIDEAEIVLLLVTTGPDGAFDPDPALRRAVDRAVAAGRRIVPLAAEGLPGFLDTLGIGTARFRAGRRRRRAGVFRRRPARARRGRGGARRPGRWLRDGGGGGRQPGRRPGVGWAACGSHPPPPAGRGAARDHTGMARREADGATWPRPFGPSPTPVRPGRELRGPCRTEPAGPALRAANVDLAASVLAGIDARPRRVTTRPGLVKLHACLRNPPHHAVGLVALRCRRERPGKGRRRLGVSRHATARGHRHREPRRP